jgi:uncharacterized membrane protein (DUF485 family)
MPGLDHLQVEQQEPDDPRTAARNARYGLFLFAMYTFVYAAFVVVNAFRPDVMDQEAWAGINLAVLSGLGLILGAFVLSLIYGYLCRSPVSPRDESPYDESPRGAS